MSFEPGFCFWTKPQTSGKLWGLWWEPLPKRPCSPYTLPAWWRLTLLGPALSWWWPQGGTLGQKGEAAASISVWNRQLSDSCCSRVTPQTACTSVWSWLRSDPYGTPWGGRTTHPSACTRRISAWCSGLGWTAFRVCAGKNLGSLRGAGRCLWGRCVGNPGTILFSHPLSRSRSCSRSSSGTTGSPGWTLLGTLFGLRSRLIKYGRASLACWILNCQSAGASQIISFNLKP